MKRKNLVMMIEIALMAATAFVLSFVKVSFFWAYGGSISLVMLPIFMMAFRWGWQGGLATGFLVGMINLVSGPTIVHPVQLVLDYLLAYTLLGVAGWFMIDKLTSWTKRITWISLGILIGTLGRFLSHFAAGVIWFGEYAPEGVPVALYSLIYNLSYLVPEMLITLVVVLLLFKYRPQFFRVRTTEHESTSTTYTG